MSAAALLASHAGLWARLPTHPFVVATAEGSLPAGAFDRWLEQDHWFVVGFRRFLARMVELAPDEGARDVLAGGLGALADELALFRSEGAGRGLDLDGTEPSPTTLGYTSYLQAAPVEGWPVALTALFGAEKAYFDAWSAVRDRGRADSPYRPFVDNWSSPAFGDWVDEVGGLVDRLAPAPELELTLGRVVRFELRFWDAVHVGETW
ncbi:MAG: transcriptional regulator [Actinomycetota bacterium]|nr:transcriptional regulator [Actinomycetota bacterium]